jgi:uncharacterized membrane protein YhiD involved in acid resistance
MLGRLPAEHQAQGRSRMAAQIVTGAGFLDAGIMAQGGAKLQQSLEVPPGQPIL